jgi:hypothetical protein
MTDVLYAAEIWLLSAALSGWLFARAAQRLRQPRPTFAQLMHAAASYELEPGARDVYGFQSDAFRRAVRLYESA